MMKAVTVHDVLPSSPGVTGGFPRGQFREVQPRAAPLVPWKAKGSLVTTCKHTFRRRSSTSAVNLIDTRGVARRFSPMATDAPIGAMHMRTTQARGHNRRRAPRSAKSLIRCGLA